MATEQRKFWGEETVDDATYAVYLEKVRYSPSKHGDKFNPMQTSTSLQLETPATLSGSVSSGSLQHSPRLNEHLQWETVKQKTIKTGTLAKLLDALLLPDGELDLRHFNIFFGTYRAFATSFEVLRPLLARYEDTYCGRALPEPCSDRKRQAILDSLRWVLLSWLDTYPEDFQADNNSISLCQIIEFAKHHQEHLRDVYGKAAELKRTMKRTQRRQQRTLSTMTDDQNNNHKRYFSTSTDYLPNGDLRAHASHRFGHSNDTSASDQHLWQALGSSALLRQLSAMDGDDFALRSLIMGQQTDFAQTPPDAVYIAEQLTYWDATIFIQLLPWQCQACFWGRRHKSKIDGARVRTVTTTVEQFNGLIQRVCASVLRPSGLSSDYRARAVEKWIEVAMELRDLKNYSSLKAIVSSLQSEPIHRLRSTWAAVSSEHARSFDDLSHFLDTAENGDRATAVGNTKSPSKFPSIDRLARDRKRSPMRRYHNRAKSDMVNQHDVQGCVPYLGPFLTNLVTIDEGMPDKDENGLLNFEKRRKEYEVLSKIKLFQSQAKNYTCNSLLRRDPPFPHWYHCLPADMDEEQRYNRSLEIEPARPSTPSVRDQLSTTPSFTQKRAMAKTSTWSRLFGNMLTTESDTEDSPRWYAIVPPSTDNEQSGSGTGSTPSMRKSQSVPPGSNRLRLPDDTYAPLIGGIGTVDSATTVVGIGAGPPPSQIGHESTTPGRPARQHRSCRATSESNMRRHALNNRMSAYYNVLPGHHHQPPPSAHMNYRHSHDYGLYASVGHNAMYGSSQFNAAVLREYQEHQFPGFDVDGSPIRPTPTARYSRRSATSASTSQLDDMDVFQPKPTVNIPKTSTPILMPNKPTAKISPVPEDETDYSSIPTNQELPVPDQDLEHPSFSQQSSSASSTPPDPKPTTPERQFVSTQTSISSKTSIDGGLQLVVHPNNSGSALVNTNTMPMPDSKRGHKHTVSNGSSGQWSTSSGGSAGAATSGDHYVLRVALDGSLQSAASTGAANYKCMRLENGDKVSTLISRALEKHMLQGDPKDYVLVQLIDPASGREFALPESCNPYYAVVPPNENSQSAMLNFVLRRRSDQSAYDEGGVGGQTDQSMKSSHSSAVVRLLKKNKNKRTRSTSNVQSTLTRWSSGYL